MSGHDPSAVIWRECSMLSVGFRKYHGWQTLVDQIGPKCAVARTISRVSAFRDRGIQPVVGDSRCSSQFAKRRDVMSPPPRGVVRLSIFPARHECLQFRARLPREHDFQLYELIAMTTGTLGRTLAPQPQDRPGI